MPVLIVAGFLVVFPAFWCFVTFMIATTGGWRDRITIRIDGAAGRRIAEAWRARRAH